MTLCTAALQAQEMVQDARQDGLMKTVAYNVSSFTDIRDKKLQDVMMKMPGLSGEEFSGSVMFTYNGMPVETIYVNGADVLEGNYQPVYNLKPEDVEKLEITENHVQVQIMQGKQYSNSSSINVILKDSAGGRWSGSVKAMAGGTPLLGTTDVNGLKLGAKVQTTVLFKADNTGLDFTGPLQGYGDYGNWGGGWGSGADFDMENASAASMGVSGSFDYNLRKFLDVEPAMAPLASERVRFNRSAIAQIGSTYKLSDDYQLNVQLTLHANWLTANSLDETTFFMGQGEDMYYMSNEAAKLHQYDVQSSATLLSNTPTQYLRNQLILNHRRIDMRKDITGTTPNLHDMHTNPILLRNDFHIKRLLGGHVLSMNAKMGYNNRPQHLFVDQSSEGVSEVLDEKIRTHSAYVDLGAKMDFELSEQWNLSFNAGGAYNGRSLATELKMDHLSGNYGAIDNELKVTNAFGGATMTYISHRMQAELKFPLIWAHYDWKNGLAATQGDTHSVTCLSPAINVKYDFTPRFSVNLSGELNQSPIDRKKIYSGLVFQDFMQAVEGYPKIAKDRSTNASLQLTYRDPEHSFFANGEVSHMSSKDAFLSYMRADDQWMVSSFMPAPDDHKSKFTMESFSISKGIGSLKGKIGLSVMADQNSSALVRGESLLPFTSNSWTLSPYINGRLSSWCNMVYKLSYTTMNMQMGDQDETSNQNYQQSLELIFSPWEKLNFSLLGEHYYTEFSDDLSKHLVLVDFKAEYNLSDRWQLLLNATNILNQKTYNYTMVDSERFTRSFTSYTIRPRNILLGIFYKF